MFRRILGIYVAASAACKDFDEKRCGCSVNNQSDYRGTISVSKSGIECQKWSSQTPNEHNYDPDSEEYRQFDLSENYCRNPDNAERPWCYTTSVYRFDYCDIPVCGEVPESNNKIYVASQYDGNAIDEQTFHNISASGSTSEPLASGDTISVELDGFWKPTNFNKQGVWSFTDATQREIGGSVEAKVGILRDGYVLNSEKLKFDSNKSQQVIKLGEAYGQMSGKGKYRISANGKTRVPLDPSDTMKMWLDSRWRGVNFDRNGAWNFSDGIDRQVGKTEIVKVGIFGENEMTPKSSVTMHFDGRKAANKINLSYKFEGEYLSPTTFKNIAGSCRLQYPMLFGQYLAVQYESEFGKEWINAAPWNTAYHWINPKVRTIGAVTKVTLGIFSDGALITTSDPIYYDGKESNNTTVTGIGASTRRSDTTYGNYTVYGKLRKPLKEGEFVSYIVDSGGYASSVKDLAFGAFVGGLKNVGDMQHLVLKIAHYDIPGRMAQTDVFYDGTTATNYVDVANHFSGQWVNATTYRNITAEGKIRYKMVDGQYLACKIGDRHWIRISLNGNAWYCDDWADRTIGEKVDMSIAIMDNGEPISAIQTVSFDGKDANGFETTYYKGTEEIAPNKYKYPVIGGKLAFPLAANRAVAVLVKPGFYLGVAMGKDKMTWEFKVPQTARSDDSWQKVKPVINATDRMPPFNGQHYKLAYYEVFV